MESIGSCVDRLFAVPGVNNLTCFLIREGIGPFLHILALLTLLSAAVLAPRVWLLLRQAPRSVWYDIAGLTALGFFLRWWLSPRCPQVFFDEVCYVQLADSLRACGRYCVEYEFPKREVIVPFLPAWPYWLSWLGRLGITEPAALSDVCIAGASLAVPLSYAAAWQLRMRRWGCAALALLTAAWPLHLRLSGCGALENGSFFLFLLLTLCLLLWHNSSDKAWIWASALVWAWFADWRMENSLIIAFVLAAALSAACEGFARLWRTHVFYAAAGTALLGAWPGLLCDIYGIHIKFYITDQTSVIGTSFMSERVIGNWLFWINDVSHPLFYTVLALAALIWKWRERRVWAWVLWFLLLNVFYGLIPTADFSQRFTNDSWRNALFPSWGVLMTAAWLFSALAGCWERAHSRWILALAVVCAAGTAVQPGLKMRFIEQRSSWMREFLLAERVGPRLPAKANLLLSGTPLRAIGDSIYVRMWNWASGRQWNWYVLPDIAVYQEELVPYPVLLKACDTWCKDKERTFLAVVGINGYDRDDFRQFWFNKYYKLRLVEGESVPYSGDYFYIYEIDGITPAAKAWLRSPRGKPAE